MNTNKLNVIANRKLIDTLEAYGNAPGKGQREALDAIISGFSDMALGRLRGRVPYPLFPGGGKTQSIVAWLSAASECGYGALSVAVCASQVEALCDLKRDLVKSGIPAERVGLIHSYRYDPETSRRYLEDNKELPQNYASEPCTPAAEVEDRPILLVTHARVKGKGGVAEYNTFKGMQRHLLIWDESLVKSRAIVINLRDLDEAINSILPGKELKDHPLALEAEHYVKTAVAQAERILENVKETPKMEEKELRSKMEEMAEMDTRLYLDPLDNTQVRAYKQILSGAKLSQPVIDFLDVCQYDLTVGVSGKTKVSSPMRSRYPRSWTTSLYWMPVTLSGSWSMLRMLTSRNPVSV